MYKIKTFTLSCVQKAKGQRPLPQTGAIFYETMLSIRKETYVDYNLERQNLENSDIPHQYTRHYSGNGVDTVLALEEKRLHKVHGTLGRPSSLQMSHKHGVSFSTLNSQTF